MAERDRKQILVVDDDQLMGIMVGEMLRCGDFKPTVFYQSVLAAEALKRERFSVLVTDLRMPEMNGLELIKQATAFDQGIGVVLMTGTPRDIKGEIEAFRKSGVCIEFLPKPFDIDTLLSMVNKVRQPVGGVA